MAPKYRQRRKECDAGATCECIGTRLGIFGLIFYFSTELDAIKRVTNFNERCHLLENLQPCFFRTVRLLMFDILRGRIVIDQKYSKIFMYKVPLMKICRPEVPHQNARTRLVRWNQIFPQLVPLWWKCLYEAWDILTHEESLKKKWN
jgi:hypothetical protein